MAGRSKIGGGKDVRQGTTEPGGDGGSKNATEDGWPWPRGRRPGRLLGAVRPGSAGGGAPAATAAPAARTRAGRVGPDHPHDRRAAPAPPLRLPAARRPARRHHRDPQLRPRRLRHVALVGHGPDGGRDGPRPRQPPGRGRRLRGGGPHRRAPAPAARVRGDHLRHVGAPGHDLEHVARGIHPHLGTDRPRPQDPRVGRPAPRSRRDLLPRAAAVGGAGLRRLLDRPLQPARHAPARRTGRCRRGRRAAASRPPEHRPGHAGARRAPFRHPLRGSKQPPAHRAGHLPRRARPRLHPLRRAHRDPQVHRAARAGGAERAPGRQLLRAGRARPLRRRRADAP